MLELLRHRRSVRFFETKAVDPEDIDRLIEAVLRAPTSRGFQPWEFIVVTESDRLEKLAAAKGHGSAFLGRAPLAFVIAKLLSIRPGELADSDEERNAT